jgi:hypothetical protein
MSFLEFVIAFFACTAGVIGAACAFNDTDKKTRITGIISLTICACLFAILGYYFD